MSTSATANFWIRFRGEMSGPYDAEFVWNLAKSGKITPVHEISVDQRTWLRFQSREELREALFPSPRPVAPVTPVDPGRDSQQAAPSAVPLGTDSPEPVAPPRRWGVILAASVAIVILVVGGAYFAHTRGVSGKPPREKSAQVGSNVILDINERIDAHVGLVVAQIKIRVSDGSERVFISGSGTGFAVSNDGLMLTNRHVIVDDEHVQFQPVKVKDELSYVPIEFPIAVRFHDDTWYEAEVVEVGKDATEDIAVIRLKNKAFPQPFQIAEDGKRLDDVLACGFPGITMRVGKELTATREAEALQQWFVQVTTGAQDPRIQYPAKSARLNATRGRITAIQPSTSGRAFLTDAYVSGGNSGGPLLNSEGQVLGIVTAVAGESGNVNIAYSVHDLVATLAIRNRELKSILGE